MDLKGIHGVVDIQENKTLPEDEDKEKLYSYSCFFLPSVVCLLHVIQLFPSDVPNLIHTRVAAVTTHRDCELFLFIANKSGHLWGENKLLCMGYTVFPLKRGNTGDLINRKGFGENQNSQKHI